MATRNVVIVLGSCSQAKQGFGIRFERREAKQWAATWAFAIKDSVAKREGYENEQMKGTFSTDESYPGCPHCSAHSFFSCGCGKLGCWNGESRRVTCASCGQSGELGSEITSLDGGGDR